MSNDVSINVKTNDQASAVLSKIDANVETMTSKTGKAIEGLGQKIGGELGEIVSKAGEGLEEFGEHGQSMGKKLAVAGAVTAGVGVALMSFGSGAKQSAQQLDAAINATGDSAEEFGKQIDQVKSKAEDFGHSGIDAENALNELVTKTGDVTQAFKYMGLVEDLAAQKHISLTAAAALVARALDGNTKLFKQYGINVATGALSVDQLNRYLDELQQRLSGQAAASVDSFSGKFEGLKEHVVSTAEDLANKFAPTLTAIGTVTTAALGVLDLYRIAHDKLTTRAVAAAAATTAEGEAAAGTIAPNLGAAGAEDTLAAAGARNAGAQGASRLATAAALGGIVLFTAGAYEGGKALSAWIEKGDTAAKQIDNLSKGTSAFTEAVKEDAGEVGNQTKAVALAQLEQAGLADKFRKSGLDIADVTTALIGNDDAFNKAIGTWRKSGQISSDTAVTLGLLHQEFDKGKISGKQLADAIAALGLTSTATESDTKNLGYAVDQTSKEFKDGADMAGRYDDAIRAILQTTTDAADSALAFQDSLQQLTDGVKENGTSLAANTVKGRANMEQMLQSIEKINGIAEAQTKQGIATGTVNGTLKDNEDALRKAAIAAGFNKDEVDFMIKKYALVPAQIVTTVNLNNDKALAGFQAVNDKIGQLNYLAGLALAGNYGELVRLAPSVDASIGSSAAASRANYAHGGIPGAATGGNRNGVIQWAEHGREMAKLPNGSYVMSNPDTERMLADQGNRNNQQPQKVQHITINQTVTRALPEPASVSGPAALRQASLALGTFQ